MASEAEHGEGDQGLGGGEPERDPGDESDLGVDRFDPSVGQAVLDRGQDRVLVFHDSALQGDERVDPAAAGPANPLVQGRGRFGRVEAEDGAEPFLQQVGPVQPWVGLGDPGELGLLPLSQVVESARSAVPSFGRAVSAGRSPHPACPSQGTGRSTSPVWVQCDAHPVVGQGEGITVPR